MLIPAIIKKNEILEAFKRYYYSDDMMYETGSLNNWLPCIQEETETGQFQYAIVNSEEKLVGYLDYHIDWYTSCASRFGLISFDRGNLIVGKDLYNELKKLFMIISYIELNGVWLVAILWKKIMINFAISSMEQNMF